MSVSLDDFLKLLVSGKGEFDANGYTFQPNLIPAVIEVVTENIRLYFEVAPKL